MKTKIELLAFLQSVIHLLEIHKSYNLRQASKIFIHLNDHKILTYRIKCKYIYSCVI